MQIEYSKLSVSDPAMAESVNNAWRKAPTMCRECPDLAVDIEIEGGIVSTVAVCGYTGYFCEDGADECTRRNMPKEEA